MDRYATPPQTDKDYAAYLPEARGGGSPVVSAWTAIAAALCAAMGPFTCYMTYLFALPLALVGLYQSWKVISSPADDAVARAMKNVSYAHLTGSVLTGLMAFFFLAILCLVMLMYLGIFVLAIVAGAAQH